MSNSLESILASYLDIIGYDATTMGKKDPDPERTGQTYLKKMLIQRKKHQVRLTWAIFVAIAGIIVAVAFSQLSDLLSVSINLFGLLGGWAYLQSFIKGRDNSDIIMQALEILPSDEFAEFIATYYKVLKSIKRPEVKASA